MLIKEIFVHILDESLSCQIVRYVISLFLISVGFDVSDDLLLQSIQISLQIIPSSASPFKQKKQAAYFKTFWQIFGLICN